MIVSKDSALYAMLIGNEDDPLPALNAAYNACVAASDDAGAKRIKAAINGLIDAEMNLRFALGAPEPTNLRPLMAVHGEAVQACQTILSKEPSYA
jgi:hypothetical protein